MKFTALAAATLAIAGVSVASFSSNHTDGTVEPGKVYTVDNVHSAVIFTVKHLNVSNFRGRFNKIEGTFDLEGNVLEVNVDPASVDTGNAKRDDHLRSPDYLSVKEFPKLSFKGKSFTKKTDNTWDVKGDLSFHGQTKEITVQVVKTGEGKGMQGGTIAGIESTFTVKRSEYGMNFMPQALSDEIAITIGAEGAAK